MQLRVEWLFNVAVTIQDNCSLERDNQSKDITQTGVVIERLYT